MARSSQIQLAHHNPESIHESLSIIEDHIGPGTYTTRSSTSDTVTLTKHSVFDKGKGVNSIQLRVINHKWKNWHTIVQQKTTQKRDAASRSHVFWGRRQLIEAAFTEASGKSNIKWLQFLCAACLYEQNNRFQYLNRQKPIDLNYWRITGEVADFQKHIPS